MAIAEFARHIEVQRNQLLLDEINPRQLYRIEIELLRTVDLRESRSLGYLGIQHSDWLLDRQSTRSVAGFLRHTHAVEAILVPSVAFPDQQDRGNLVVFVDNVALESAVRSVTMGAIFTLSET